MSPVLSVPICRLLMCVRVRVYYLESARMSARCVCACVYVRVYYLVSVCISAWCVCACVYVCVYWVCVCVCMRVLLSVGTYVGTMCMCVRVCISSGSRGQVRGGVPRNVKAMQLPLGAIFFMTNFYRARGGHGPSTPIRYWCMYVWCMCVRACMHVLPGVGTYLDSSSGP